MNEPADAAPDAFIARWGAAGGSERANYQLFVNELCELLGVPTPDPARDDTRDNAYVFERRVTFRHGDGSESAGFIDLYRRGAFVLEAKKLRRIEGKGFDDAMLRARAQAEQYARALPAAEGRPPFLVVVDVGNVIELYAEFTRSGATYVPFPDPRSHRVRLSDLRRADLRERLRRVWLDPLELDPSRRSARVTREIAAKLADIAKALERAGHGPETVAQFLTRCLFTMFAEDVGLLPKHGFVTLLESLARSPEQFAPLVGELWCAMDAGAFSVVLRTDVLRFNGKLFREPHVLPLDRDQIGLLIEAARFDWRDVEPAIFGTLLERALNPAERHALGAHYTPRAYVERLVLPTVVEPLREDWKNAQAAALVLAADGKLKEARAEIHAFHHKLCATRVLDPACGSGNFLYVTLEHLKRLEGEVLNQLEELGDTQGRLETEGLTVDPHQLLGLEINPRAAAIAEMVLWIGYLQWHFRTRGQVMPPQPVLKDFRNIEQRDAVLAYDSVEYVCDEHGALDSRWDGKTMKKHPVTGADVPDETARVPLERYVNPRKADWPQADFVVGNPPFIGGWRLRQTQGDGYVEALWGAYPEVPPKADFVMSWWDHAAEQTRAGKMRRFGLITTNSIAQVFQRRVVERHLSADPPLSIAYAVPDHPWVDTADGADVRIAMTVAEQGEGDGILAVVTAEEVGADGANDVSLNRRRGRIHANLALGANAAMVVALRANAGLCSPGVQLYGAGFIVDADEAEELRAVTDAVTAHRIIRQYANGRDFMQTSRGAFVIDFYGYDRDAARAAHPAAFQRLLDRVKPERDSNRRQSIREKWWRFGWERPVWREAVAGLARFVSTPETSKHRVFAFVDGATLPDNMLTNIAVADGCQFGILLSRIHIVWALALGGRLGVGNDPRYTKTRCFETFPFPDPSPEQTERIRSLAEQIDAYRKRQLAAHPGLTLTGLYNVIEKLRSGEALTAKERVIHEQGLASVLKELHDELDAAVFAAYGWSDLAARLVGRPGATTPLADKPGAQAEAEEELLTRLVALNAERAAEEKRGRVRWLRPDLQKPAAARAPEQAELETGTGDAAVEVAAAQKRAWPTELPDQVRTVAQVLAEARQPMTADELAACFTGRGPWKKRLPQVLATLEAVGRLRKTDAGAYSTA